MPNSRVFRNAVAAYAAGVMSLGAAAIHFSVIADHFSEDAAEGLFFAVVAWFQALWALAYVYAPRRSLATIAIVVNAGVVAIWLWSRTVGLSFGPNSGQVEATGTLDGLATALEIVLMATLLVSLRSGSLLPRRDERAPAAVYAVSAVVLIVLLSSAALAASGGGHHSHAPVGSDGHSEEAAQASVGDTGAGGGSTAPTEAAASADSPAADDIPSARPSTEVRAGTIVFGTGLDPAGNVANVASSFEIGQEAAWVARFGRPVGVRTLVFRVSELRGSAREIEHWRQEIEVADPRSTYLVSVSELSVFAHAGAGQYVMRYSSADEVLAEGEFELLP